MSQARAIDIVNSSGESGFNTRQTKVLRKLVDVIYADIAAGVAGVVIVSADALNNITAGSDGGAFYDAP